MRSLLIFIYKFHAFFLFLFLESLAGYFVVQYNYYHKASFLNSTNSLVSVCYNITSQVSGYIGLRRVNVDLAKENAILKSRLEKALYNKIADTTTVNDSFFTQKYYYISAEVINNSINRRNNYLTLNKGSLHGIEKNMAVISSKGIIGIVKDTSILFSSVMSLLHKDSKISAKILNDDNKGTIKWEGSDPKVGTLINIPKHAELHKGDSVVTSGYSALFPEGIMIGTIIDFKLDQGDNFYTIWVDLATDFNTVEHVYIVNNLMKTDQRVLEARSQNDKPGI